MKLLGFGLINNYYGINTSKLKSVHFSQNNSIDKPTLLYVEDHPTYQEFVPQTLAPFFQVTVAHTSNEAKELFTSNDSFDYVLSDGELDPQNSSDTGMNLFLDWIDNGFDKNKFRLFSNMHTEILEQFKTITGIPFFTKLRIDKTGENLRDFILTGIKPS